MGNWALSICVACILVGVLEFVLPPRESFKSIKTVLALYILLAVVSPVKQADWSGLIKAMETSHVAPRDYSGYVDAYSQTALADSLQSKLSAAGLSAQVEIKNTDPLQVYVCSNEPERAKALLQNELAQAEDLQIIAEELQNDA